MADAALLNLVLYLPLIGIAGIVLLPAGRDERVRRLSLVRDAGAVRPHRMAVRAFRRRHGRAAVRDPAALDRRLGRVLPDRPRRLQRAAGAADRVPRPAGRRRRVHRHPEGREALLRDGLRAAVRDAGHVPRAGPVRVLSVLGDDAHPAVPHHRHLGRRAAHLRDAQVRALHRFRQHPDARRSDLSRLFAQCDLRRYLVRVCRPVSGGTAAERADAPARRLRAVVRDQGADRAAAHVAPRRARRGADRGLGDPGRRAAEDGNVRLHEARLSPLPGCDAAVTPRYSRRSRW